MELFKKQFSWSSREDIERHTGEPPTDPPPSKPERSYRAIKAIKESLKFCRTPTSTYTYCFSSPAESCSQAAGSRETAFLTPTSCAGAAALMGQARRRVANCFMFRADTKVSTAQEEKVANKGQDGQVFAHPEAFSPSDEGKGPRWRDKGDSDQRLSWFVDM